MFHRLKSLVPAAWLAPYHRALSWLAAVWYGNPSNKLIVVGVTGTNGKTTTTYLIAKALEASGYRTGCTSTALFKIGEREWLNDTKMTMLGRFRLQKFLHEMVSAGCRFAVVETSSQGTVQSRHRDINYDVVVLTNLTPEHIEAHGGFEKYKQAKIELFRHAARSPRKMFNGIMIPKIAVLNAGEPHAQDFAVPGFDQTMWYAREQQHAAEIMARDIQLHSDHVTFRVHDTPFSLHLPGVVNVENALAAIAVAHAFGLRWEDVAGRLGEIPGVPGRFERIDEGQPWTVIVDYAPEPESLARLYETLAPLSRARIIHVLGSAGGGRDVSRRPVLGRMAGERADIVIVTNEDPYDDNPRTIMDQVAEGARGAGKTLGENLFVIEDRAEAIREAMRLARQHDLVILTGKGSEQAMCVAGGKKIPWDEREAAREAIRRVVGRAGG